MDGVLERIKANLYKTSDGEIIDVAVLEPEEIDYIFSVIEFREEDIKKLEGRLHSQADLLRTYREANERLQNECSYWKMKYHDLVDVPKGRY